MTPQPKSKKINHNHYTDLLDFSSIENNYNSSDYRNKNKNVDVSGYFGQPQYQTIKGMGTYSANQILSHTL